MNENKATIWQTWIILMVAAVVVMGLHWGGLQNYLQQTRPDLEQPAWPDALRRPAKMSRDEMVGTASLLAPSFGAPP